jgi:hypothetical protein
LVRTHYPAFGLILFDSTWICKYNWHRWVWPESRRQADYSGQTFLFPAEMKPSAYPIFAIQADKKPLFLERLLISGDPSPPFILADSFDSLLFIQAGNRGDEGKSLVEQFMKADAEYTIRIDFVDPGKMNGAMAQSVNLYNKVNVDINAGMNNDNIGYEAAALGHELVHLLRQSSVEQGTAKAEKEAYEVSEKLYKSMGLDPIPMVKALSPLGSSPEEMQKVAIYTNSNLKTPFLNYANPLARALAIVPWEFITNCYGNVCIIPGGQSYQYHSPTE